MDAVRENGYIIPRFEYGYILICISSVLACEFSKLCTSLQLRVFVTVPKLLSVVFCSAFYNFDLIGYLVNTFKVVCNRMALLPIMAMSCGYVVTLTLCLQSDSHEIATLLFIGDHV